MNWIFHWLRAATLGANAESLMDRMTAMDRQLAREAKRLSQMQIDAERLMEKARHEVEMVRAEMDRLQDHYEHALDKERQRNEINETITIPMLTQRLELEEARVRAQIAVQSRIQMQDVGSGGA